MFNQKQKTTEKKILKINEHIIKHQIVECSMFGEGIIVALICNTQQVLNKNSTLRVYHTIYKIEGVDEYKK